VALGWYSLKTLGFSSETCGISSLFLCSFNSNLRIGSAGQEFVASAAQLLQYALKIPSFQLKRWGITPVFGCLQFQSDHYHRCGIIVTGSCSGTAGRGMRCVATIDIFKSKCGSYHPWFLGISIGNGGMDIILVRQAACTDRGGRDGAGAGHNGAGVL
jgi:hypothetical protein